jgi:hypothetical protein
MAKQNFTTGQILTANQMLDLQQTAMGGGAATAKTASYVLVAADAGSTVAMNAAGATTITVNTALFAAGDTVFIQNLGAGLCTVTAGTATVSTAGSLILPQYDAGILYFTSASNAIFYDYIQTGATSPLTTKGDLYTFGTSDTRLGVGANGTTLVADSAEATGLKWQAASSGALTLITPTSTANSGGSVSTSGGAVTATGCESLSLNGVFTSTYTNYVIQLNSIKGNTDIDVRIRLRASGTDTTTGYYVGGTYVVYSSGTVSGYSGNNDNFFLAAQPSTSIEGGSAIFVNNPQLAVDTQVSNTFAGRTAGYALACHLRDSTQYDGFTLFASGSQNWTGTVRVYGFSN